MPRRYPGCPGSVGGDDLGENGGVWRMGYNGPVSRIGLSSEKAPCEPHIPMNRYPTSIGLRDQIRNDALPLNVFGCVFRYVFCTYLVFVLHTCMIRVFQAVRARIYHLGV